MNEKTAVKRLFDMEIDEVSTVDRPANQLSAVAFAKADTDVDDDVAIFDSQGNAVDYDQLLTGDVVYSADGEELVFIDDDESALVGKAASEPLDDGFSLGDLLLEELSKASSDAERQQVMAKALSEVEIFKAQAEQAWEIAEHERDLRLTDEFIAKADEYNLPVAPQILGPILKAMAQTLSDEQLDVIDKLFTSVGDMLFSEVGYAGENANDSVLDAVNARAAELVGKAADVSGAQAMVDVLSANPDAYDAYLAEGRLA